MEARENVFLRAEADKNGGERATIDPEAVTSQIQLVLSRDLAREVIKKEKLADNPEFDPALRGPSVLRVLLSLFGIGRDPAAMTQGRAHARILLRPAQRLRGGKIPRDRRSTSSRPIPTSPPASPTRSPQTYLKMQQTAKQDQTRAAGDWLAGEIANLRIKVADAEAKVEAYRAKSNLFVGSNNTSLPNQQLTEINSQISAARGQKADLEARARQLRDLIRSGKPIESSDIANSESMRRLIEQRNALRSQLAEQSTTLLDQHPRIKELQGADRRSRARNSHRGRAPGAPSSTTTPRSPATGWRRSPPASTRSKSLPRRPTSRTCNCARSSARPRPSAICSNPISAKYREATARDNINAAPPEARIISRASPSIKPDYPKKLPTVLIAAFAAFALSAGFIVTGALLAAAPSSAMVTAMRRRHMSRRPSAARMPPMPPRWRRRL